MEHFYYRAVSQSGKVIEETISSESAELLRYELENKGFHIYTIKKKGQVFSGQFRFSHGISMKKLLIFNQELLVLLSAGLTVVDTVEILRERVDNDYLSDVLLKVREDIKSGKQLSESMARFPAVFPELFVSSLKAGEKTGNLTEVLERYIAYQKIIISLKKKVFRALSYPAALCLLSLGVIIFLLAFVLPTFSEIYLSSGSEMPLLTRIFLGMTSLFTRYYWISLVSVPPGILILWRFFNAAPGRVFFDRMVLSLPLIGNMIIAEKIVRISRMLSMILKSGIPFLEAVGILSESIANKVLSERLLSVADRIREGVPLASAFAELKIVPRISLEMLDVGARTGSLVEMFNNIADFHEEELDISLDRLATWMEPLMLLVTGVIVALIVIAMYLPIFNLADAIG